MSQSTGCDKTKLHYESARVSIDEWCSNNLIRLSTREKLATLSADAESRSEQINPFLFYDTSAQQWMTCGGVWVHVFYTEDIDISPESLQQMGAEVTHTDAAVKNCTEAQKKRYTCWKRFGCGVCNTRPE